LSTMILAISLVHLSKKKRENISAVDLARLFEQMDENTSIEKVGNNAHLLLINMVNLIKFLVHEITSSRTLIKYHP
jgi:hypothetical protein